MVRESSASRSASGSAVSATGRPRMMIRAGGAGRAIDSAGRVVAGHAGTQEMQETADVVKVGMGVEHVLDR